MTAGSRCYAAGYSDVPQFFKAKLTDDGRRRQSSHERTKASPRSLTFPSRPGRSRREQPRDESIYEELFARTSSPFTRKRGPHLVPAASPVTLTFPRRSVSVNICTCRTRVSVLLRFPEYIMGSLLCFFYLSRPRQATGSYRARRNTAIWLDPSPITRPNLEGYTGPDMSAHVFTWRIDSAYTLYTRGSYKNCRMHCSCERQTEATTAAHALGEINCR